MNYFPLIAPFTRMVSEETAHDLAIGALSKGIVPPQCRVASPKLEQEIWGIRFSNPVGLAAGFDKNAAAISGLAKQGFGFLEVGTVTPKPQAGNPKPRLFRLPEHRAIVNRLGFNNAGLDAYCDNLARAPQGMVIGANIGKNKDSEEALVDYITCFRRVYPLVSYITVNISSPNTPGLRQLQSREPLVMMIKSLQAVRSEMIEQKHAFKPILIKFAPDLEDEDLEMIAEVAQSTVLDGMILTNTTIARPDYLGERWKSEAGGLSGKPVFERSTHVLKRMYQLTYGRVPLIGVGGIASAEDAYAKIRAGASLVQVYSALIYQGFALVPSINKGLLKLLERDGFAHVKDAVGANSS